MASLDARKSKRARSLAALLAAVCANASAADLYCWEEPGTLRNTCVVPNKITVNGDLRASPIYMGGPKDVNPTSITLVVNCKTGWTTGQDRQGSNFTAGAASSTQMLTEQKNYLCATKNPKRDPSLRQ